jgi:hypothetical protein
VRGCASWCGPIEVEASGLFLCSPLTNLAAIAIARPKKPILPPQKFESFGIPIPPHPL